MNKTRRWIYPVCVTALVLIVHTAGHSQVDQIENNRLSQSRPAPVPTRPASDPAKRLELANPNISLALPTVMPLGSEKLAHYKTGSGWHYAIGTVDVMLPRNGACLVTCNLDVQSHVQTGFLTFRTARLDTSDGTSESDDGWAMDVPVPASQTSASTTFAWNMTGGRTYRFGCRTLADRGFLDIDVYPNVSWICR